MRFYGLGFFDHLFTGTDRKSGDERITIVGNFYEGVCGEPNAHPSQSETDAEAHPAASSDVAYDLRAEPRAPSDATPDAYSHAPEGPHGGMDGVPPLVPPEQPFDDHEELQHGDAQISSRLLPATLQHTVRKISVRLIKSHRSELLFFRRQNPQFEAKGKTEETIPSDSSPGVDSKRRIRGVAEGTGGLALRTNRRRKSSEILWKLTERNRVPNHECGRGWDAGSCYHKRRASRDRRAAAGGNMEIDSQRLLPTVTPLALLSRCPRPATTDPHNGHGVSWGKKRRSWDGPPLQPPIVDFIEKIVPPCVTASKDFITSDNFISH